MDHSSPKSADPVFDREPFHRSRALANTSGNAQVIASDIKGSPDLCNAVISGVQLERRSQRPAPLPILGFNDRTESYDRLAARKAKRISLLNNDRHYLQTEQYKIYKERKRQDIGKDGNPVWPDHIEESFQNALVHILPMGRKKKTQFGKGRGRNELIAEWIKQDTGEIRGRKQISSHIQVLNKHLANVPEWKLLTTVRDDDNEHEHNDTGYGYYHDSIADAVRIQKELSRRNRDDTAEESWSQASTIRFSLSKLAFELWVGTPEYITHALHNYTRIPNIHSPMRAVPLENFDNWRDLFPDLERTLQSGSDGEYDIVLVRSSIALMSDFPPKTSKLGLVLDLDFRSPVCEDMKTLSEMKYWSSINNMYLDGRTLRRTEHRDCQSAEFGLVKPFFEADWWAAQFTEMTHKRKEVEECIDGQSLMTADEYSRNLFRGLSIMQEVFASPFSANDPTRPRRRMAVLLWVFSQAGKGQAGVSSWQKVIAPPSRVGVNSPLAPGIAIGSSLPPLVLDSMVESSFDSTMTDIEFPLQEPRASTSFSPTIHGTGSYNTGLTPLQNMNHDHLRFYDFTGTGFTPRFSSFTDPKDDSFNFDAPLGLVPPLNYSQVIPTHRHAPNVFDHLAMGDDADATFTSRQADLSHAQTEASSTDRRQCLANFDVTTHQMLQAQLDSVQPKLEHSPQEDYIMIESESQGSVINHMNNLELQMDASQIPDDVSNNLRTPPGDTMSDEQRALCHPSAFESPKITRPPLLPHNSFAGVLPSTTDDDHMELEHISFDTPTRNDFAKLIENHYMSAGHDAVFEAGESHEIEHRMFAHGNCLVRPRSQPVLRSNVSLAITCNEKLHLGGTDNKSPIHTN